MIARAIALAAFVFSVSPAWADAASEAMMRDFVARIDGLAEWTASAGSIRSEGADTVAETVRFANAGGRLAFEIGSLRAGNLSRDADGGFSTTAVAFEDAVARFALAIPAPADPAAGGGAPANAAAMSVEYRIPAGEIDGLSAPSFAAFSFDPNRAMTSIAKAYSEIARIEFGAVSIPEFATSQSQGVSGGAVDTTTSTRNVRISGMSKGVIGAQELGPATLTFTTPDGTFRAEIARIFADRMDLGAFAHILDPTAYRDGRGDGVWRPALSRSGYEELTLSGPMGVSGRLDGVSVEGLDFRQADEPFAADFDVLFDPDVASELKSDQAIDAVLGLYSTMRLGTLRVSGAAFEGMPEGASEPTAFGLDDLSLSGLSSDGLDSLLLKGLRFAAPTGAGALDTFELAGFVAPDVRKLMAFAALEDTAPADQSAATIRETFAALPRLAHLGLSGLSFGATPEASVKVGAFAFDLRDWNEFFAQSTDVWLEGFDAPRAMMKLEPQVAEIVDGLGLDRFVLGATLTDRWSPEAGADEASWKATLADAGDIELSYVLTGMTRDWITSAIAAAGKGADSTAAMDAMMARLGLKQATLRVTDRSILDRAMGVAARKQNLSVDGRTYRTQMAAALPFLLPAALPADLAKLLSKPLQDFMAGGQTLIAEITPPAPIPLPDIAKAAEGDPMALPAKLGVTVRSEAAGPAN